ADAVTADQIVRASGHTADVTVAARMRRPQSRLKVHSDRSKSPQEPSYGRQLASFGHLGHRHQLVK
ncbi:MAG: hypothetical protein C5B58_01080, partial [Acidobacteria bacterium]